MPPIEHAAGRLNGRVAIVTGAARGIGLEHARLLAREGARVVVCDIAGAEDAAAGIQAEGGWALAHIADCANWDAAHRLVDAAVQAFGGLHILVNNAGVGGSVPFETMSEAEWDSTIAGNLKLAAAPTRAAVAYWRGEFDAARPPNGSVINTTSGAGLFGNVGASHYGAAKAGIAAFTLILAKELAGLGVRVNAVAPAARTPMSSVNPVVANFMRPPDDPAAFDAWGPAQIAPLVAYLASADCPLTGKVFHVRGGVISCLNGWSLGPTVTSDGPWSVDEIAARLPHLAAEAERLAGAGEATYDALRNALKDDVLSRAAAERGGGQPAG
jgi:NAD(P)-dependent dehydrogenase (short-subunit alcohol dehydrogenase family)